MMSPENYPAISVEYQPDLIPWNFVRELVKAAHEAGKDEVFTRHLVGASLHLALPEAVQDNPASRVGDRTVPQGHYLVGDTVFQVIMAPFMEVYDKCRENLENGFRVWLLVPEKFFCGTRQNAEIILPGKVTVASIESFVGQSLERLAGFSRKNLKNAVRRFLETYNDRIRTQEQDQGLLINIPPSLRD
jgi:hypothetical protein